MSVPVCSLQIVPLALEIPGSVTVQRQSTTPHFQGFQEQGDAANGLHFQLNMCTTQCC